MKKQLVTLAVTCAALCSLAAGEAQSVLTLPAPQKTGGKPLMQTITERKTTRSFKNAPLPDQIISNLLYAAWGYNRADKKRVIPTAMNRQNMDVYVLNAKGVYRYDAANNALVLWKEGDLRGSCFMKPEMPLSAPVVLVYVAKDTDKIPMEFSAAHAGAAFQNVYLYCASEGLATVICAGFDKKALTEKMNLPENQTVLFSQPVAYPKD